MILWDIFFIMFLFNSVICIIQFVLQQMDSINGRIPLRHSLAPAGRKFLYLQDFYTQTYGNLIGGALIVNAFTHLVIRDQILNTEWYLFAFIIALFTYLHLTKNCVERKSYRALIKLIYSSFMAGMSVVVFIHMVNGQIYGILLWITILGGLIYLVSYILDIIAGHYK